MARRRVCVITGAGGTLGSRLCQRFAPDYEVLAVCRTRLPAAVSQLERYVDPLAPGAELAENAHPVYALRADLEAAGAIDRIVEVAVARYGTVDLLVNCAAYSAWQPRGVLDGDAALREVDRHFAVNVRIPLELAVRFAQRCWTADDTANRAANRNVVNVSSLAGSRLFPHQGQAVYAASKAALDQLTRHLGSEFAAFGVRVNAVAPDSFPSVVSVDAVVDAIRDLDAGAMTGTVLAVAAP